ncbi:MAG: DUF1415 domain-containing protein [Bacteroidota bacterium]
MHHIQTTKSWIEKFVIKHNLCPFAAFPFRKEKIRYCLEITTSEEQLLTTLHRELLLLHRTTTDEVETAFIIHPHVLNDFLDYNDFVHTANELLQEMNLEGEIQIASFHPNYQFAGEPKDDPSNFVARSPFPMLHLLREDSVATAIQNHANTAQIPLENIDKMNELGLDHLNLLLGNLSQENSKFKK